MIKEAAESLVLRPWHEIQLTLRTFGLQTWEPEYGFDDADKLGYCTRQIEDASDEVLLGLHEYLLGDDAAPAAVRTTDGLWGDLPVRVFLSHLHAQRVFVGGVKSVLANFYGISAFVAHDDIQPNKQWRQVIRSALGSCHAFVAFLDEGFHDSQWCDQEVGWALARNIPVLPVRPVDFDRTNARDGFLEEHQDICLDRAPANARERWVAEQIFQTIIKDSRTQDVAIKAAVEAFVHSHSFDRTRSLWNLIERQEQIESEQLRRLEYAVQTNRQVYEAVGDSGKPIPDLVGALIEGFEPTIAPPSYAGWGDDEEPF